MMINNRLKRGEMKGREENRKKEYRDQMIKYRDDITEVMIILID